MMSSTDKATRAKADMVHNLHDDLQWLTYSDSYDWL